MTDDTRPLHVGPVGALSSPPPVGRVGIDVGGAAGRIAKAVAIGLPALDVSWLTGWAGREMMPSYFGEGDVGMGTVAQLWRFPVKSMLGESLDVTAVTAGGVLGDRGYALIDADTGKIASAKNPRKWPDLLSYSARYAEPLDEGRLPPVQIRLPDGGYVGSDAADVDQVLSRSLGRKVSLSRAAPASPQLEEYWPDMEELDHQDTVTDEAMPPGTFFDLASLHLLTTGTLARLRELYPQGRFDIARFRPNVVVDTGAEVAFVENAWIGHTIAVGDAVQLRVTGGCPRCVMTTLPQGGLPKDREILRTAARHNDSHVGVYAEVVTGGTVQRGDTIDVIG